MVGLRTLLSGGSVVDHCLSFRGPVRAECVNLGLVDMFQNEFSSFLKLVHQY